MTVFAQLIVSRVLNALPEGLLLAAGAWLLLRLLGRQNAGTRFAVWMVALAGVVALPFIGGITSSRAALAPLHFHGHSAVLLPALWAVAFLGLWTALATVALARVLFGLHQVRQIRGECRELPVAAGDPAWRDLLLCQTKRTVRLLVSETARVPAAIGFFRPAIVLPAWTLRDLSPEQLRPILIHELAHLERHDDWTNLLQKAIRAVLFFHPAVWWIDARLSLEREMACDDAVLAATGNPHAYAGSLIGLLERSCARRGWTMAQAAVARARDASLRIARILHVGLPPTTRVRRGTLGLAAALSLVCSAVVLCAPHLIGFTSVVPSDTLASRAALLDSGIEPPPAAVVPALFHPAERTALVHTAVMTRVASARPVSDRPVPNRPRLRSARPAPVLVRRAVVEKRRRVTPRVVLAGLQQPPASNPPVEMAMLLVLEAPDASRPGAVASPVAANSSMGSGMAAPAFEIQTLQFIEETPVGLRVQTIRVVLIAPQGGVFAKSI